MYDFPFKDNGLFISYAFLTPNTDNQKVESIILNEYSKIANDGITENELKKAKAQISSDISFSRDGSYAIAGALNEALAIGDWKFYTNFIDNINNGWYHCAELEEVKDNETATFHKKRT